MSLREASAAAIRESSTLPRNLDQLAPKANRRPCATSSAAVSVTSRPHASQLQLACVDDIGAAANWTTAPSTDPAEIALALPSPPARAAPESLHLPSTPPVRAPMRPRRPPAQGDRSLRPQ